jgi:hypothetical protein
MPIEPLVTRLSADVVTATELGVTEIADLSLENELGPFDVHGGSSPPQAVATR